MEEFPKIVQGRRKHHLIGWAGRNLEHWDSDDVADDLRINRDEMAYNRGLKHHSTIIILHHFQVGVEEFDQSSVHHTRTTMEISPILRLDDAQYVVQRWHHDISPKDIPLSNDYAVHDLGLKCSPIFHKLLTDPVGWIAGRHDSTKKKIQQEFCPKKIFPKIFLLG
jgi:hypothetical protein